jgi:hypothetical protein
VAFLENLPNPLMKLDYVNLGKAATQGDVTEFLGAQTKSALTTSLKKQRQNRVIDRFANAQAMKACFDGCGRGDWLGEEL